jgi:hypothetical protein
MEFFALATRENGFFAPVDMAIALADMDWAVLSGEEAGENLVAEIEKRLGVA